MPVHWPSSWLPVFNIQPGQGLGFPASKQIALGLGTPFGAIIIILPAEVALSRPGGGGPGAKRLWVGREDREIREIILIIAKSGILN